jgi:hypothetical protein
MSAYLRCYEHRYLAWPYLSACCPYAYNKSYDQPLDDIRILPIAEAMP